ncbi:hypothetical protein E2C01_087815 [Portunus trituberculatus]|uniref:Uncharacterized protein n=1 Tax=Portunus trituberculatus TaxID=210409 RepID=A0A5B7J7M5_PORTR|nr:hypothetical protein [Portunus trituberculatus]
MGLSLKNSGLREKWEETGFQTEWLMSRTYSVSIGSFKRRLDKIMDGDDRWN